jgi:hypothetical protein
MKQWQWEVYGGGHGRFVETSNSAPQRRDIAPGTDTTPAYRCGWGHIMHTVQGVPPPSK